MGIIDTCTYTLTCKHCNITESASVLDKGSNWSGSWWGGGATFLKFTTKWTGGEKTEPDLTMATCNTCGRAAETSSKYSM